MRHKTLWFIALLPPDTVTEKVRAVQHEIADRFGPKSILKIPVHITLEPPFRLDDAEEPRLDALLRKFFATKENFSLKLKNFGSFRENVVFIEVAPSLPLLEIHGELSGLLRADAIVKTAPWQGGYTPHMTVANRDVTPEAHHHIWREFNTRKFYAEFSVEDIALLRHDEKLWQVHRRFPLLKSSHE
jgi:2'-5' RNA ligase